MNSRILIYFVFIQMSVSTFVSSLYKDSEYSNRESSLQLVAIVHRHGLRAPGRTWPTDPYRDQKKFWPAGWDQLVLEGKRQMFRLGKTLRIRYKNFVHRYSPDAVRVNSSDFNRCHMSAAVLLAGWFPPERGQVWSANFNWQPIPINSVPVSKDPIIALGVPCERYNAQRTINENELFTNLTEEDKTLVEYLSKNSGQPITGMTTAMGYLTNLIIEDDMGYELPNWAKEVYPHNVTKLARLGYSAWIKTKYMRRISGGGLIKEIMDQFKMRTEGLNKKQKLLVYSGHDSNILGVWSGLELDINEIFVPAFGSALIFELHESMKRFYVKMFYMNDTTVSIPFQVNIPRCSAPCYFTNLYTVTKYMRSVDFEKDCTIE